MLYQNIINRFWNNPNFLKPILNLYAPLLEYYKSLLKKFQNISFGISKKIELTYNSICPEATDFRQNVNKVNFFKNYTEIQWYFFKTTWNNVWKYTRHYQRIRPSWSVTVFSEFDTIEANSLIQKMHWEHLSR